jgi:putative spermidine/putrescine transport system substrate-binding protein
MARNNRKQPSPAIHRQRTLRVLGTDISLLEAVRLKAISDLGFNIEFEVLDFPNCQRKAALNPEAYDVYDQCFHNLAIVWFWGALQPIDTTWLSKWSKVSALTKSGGVGKYASRGFGDAPMHKLYVQPDHSLGPEETRYIAMLPTVHNFDSFGYDTRVFNTDGNERESWAMLFDPRAKGKLALVDEPAIGLFDVALAAEAMGILRFENIGNMSPAEIGALFKFLKDKRKEGFFRRCWRTGEQAAKLFRDGDVVIQSMWSPAYNELGSAAAVVKEAVPAEGYRAWHGAPCLGANASHGLRIHGLVAFGLGGGGDGAARLLHVGALGGHGSPERCGMELLVRRSGGEPGSLWCRWRDDHRAARRQTFRRQLSGARASHCALEHGDGRT